MWLDRFSGNNTPLPAAPLSQNRSYSPRRPSHLGPGTAARPSFSQRSSSLYLGSKSNLSTTSINSRVPNGSALKNEIPPPGDFPDPLQALADVVGRPLPEQLLETNIKDGEEGPHKPSCLIQDVDFQGLSLHDFAKVDFPTGDDEQPGIESNAQRAEECEYVCPIYREEGVGSNAPRR